MSTTLYHFVGSFVTKLQSVPLSQQCLHALQNNRLHAIITWQNYESKTYLTTGSDTPSPVPGMVTVMESPECLQNYFIFQLLVQEYLNVADSVIRIHMGDCV